LAIKSIEGKIVFEKNSRQLLSPLSPPSQRAGDVVYPSFSLIPTLACGDYLLSVGVASDCDGTIVPHDRRYDSIALRVVSLDSVEEDIDMVPKFRFVERPQ